MGRCLEQMCRQSLRRVLGTSLSLNEATGETVMNSSAATDSRVLLALSVVIMLAFGFIVFRGSMVEATVMVDRQQIL